MILIITHKQDYTVDFVINKLNQQAIPYKRLNCEDINEIGFRYSVNQGQITTSVGEITSYKSVWYRRRMLPNLSDITNENERDYLLSEYKTLLENLFQMIEGKWLSNPSNVEIAENKLLQLKYAREIGFKVPETLVTQDKNDLREFYYRCGERVIIKPIGNGRIVEEDEISLIFTNRLNKEQIERLSEYNLTPCIYQEELDKQYELRVTVVGEKVFTARIDSQVDEETEIDWRRKKIKTEKYDLPPEIAEKCIELNKKLRISFGAIDLVRTKNGDYVFLENNPNGQWAWIEIDTGMPISNAIINYLLD